ncbi:hypothetical protein Strain138_000483 [Pseudogemmatithrix spongiicola]|uniref:Uncharacterized protein n=1 Tax=Pseudogemmatithrix spongiicola TaxID=3062599 RepID=A0AA49Q6L3_9BACT|nr:hypothetical protein Strain138_000483 [Gemmatimonadaceae bacterium 'strain 138']WKW14157.1 hypothetical protein Strain318_000483 [Gemmatimonadaceae bacterium 'strain 318']
MKILMTLIAALTVVAADSPPPAPSAPAQGGCYGMWYCTGGHYMLPGPIGAYRDHHGDCRVCLVEGGCHAGCFEVDAGKKVDYTRMVASAAAMDVQGVIDAAAVAREFALFNSERSSVQILSCDKATIIASIPVEGVTRQLAAARLRGVPTHLAAGE